METIDRRARMPGLARGSRIGGFLLLVAACCVPCFAAPTARSGEPLEVVDLQLRWKHQFQFAGYYAALEKGYYRDAGLDVRLHEGAPGRGPVDEVLAGRAAYGTANSELLVARLNGSPVVALAAIFQHSPSVLLVRADSGIRTPHDLVGRKVMLMGGRQDTDFQAMFLREGVHPESIEIVPSSFEVADLINGRVDAFNAYLSNEPFVMQERGIAFWTINPSHYGVDHYGDVLFTTEREVREHPERVRALREATLLGWRFAMDHPEEVVDLLRKRYKVTKTKAHLEFEAATVRAMILPDLVEIGHMNPGRWQAMAEMLKSVGLVADDRRLNGFLFDPDPHVWRMRLRNTVMSMGGVLVLTLLAVAYMFATTRRLRKEIALRREVEERLRSANDLLQRTGRLAKVGGFEKNIAGDSWVLTEEAARIRETLHGVPIPFEESMRHYPEPERSLRAAEGERAVRDGAPWEYESLLTLPSGKQTWIFSRGEAVYRDGQVVKLVGAMQDITDRKMAELALKSRTRELEMHNSILRQIHEGVTLPDVLGSLASQAEMLSPGMHCAMLMRDAAGAARRGLHHIAAPSLPAAFVCEMDALLAGDEHCAGNRVAASGDRMVLETLGSEGGAHSADAEHMAAAGFAACWLQPVKGRERRVLGVFAVYRRVAAAPTDDDIRLLETCASLAALVIEHALAEEKIRNLAYYDVLTQLPNRRMLVDRLRQAMAGSRRNGAFGALMFLDLDNFKPLNDRCGHHAGDLLLIQVAQRIGACVRETDTVARFGGDEFVIMLAELDASVDVSRELAVDVAEKIRCVIAAPFLLTVEREGQRPALIEHRCTASIGIVLFRDREAALDDIIRWADEAMYCAKAQGRNGVCVHADHGA